MMATIHTSEGPQWTMEAAGALEAVLALPAGDYFLEIHPRSGVNVMHPPRPPKSDTEGGAAPASPPIPPRIHDLGASVGAGGFISVTSICGLVDHRKRKLSLWRHPLHAGR